MKKTAIVTGANRGLGYATAQALREKGYEVIFASRHTEDLKAKGLTALQLDVADPASSQSFVQEVQKVFSHLDVLVNNAGIFKDDLESGVLKTSPETLMNTFKTNTVGPFLITQALWPLLKKAETARVVNVSSGMGQLSEMAGGASSYRISKTALNAVTKIYATEAAGTSILVNSICPGWVRTDMGGAGATRTIEEGISGILWAATIPTDGPNGGFFRDGKRMDW